MKIKRILYGYRTKKKSKNKIYISEDSGLLSELKGSSLGPGVVVIPYGRTKQLKDVFQSHKISYEEKDIMLREGVSYNNKE